MNSEIKIIAEIGWNHMGDTDLAEKMISQAASSEQITVNFKLESR